MADTRCPQCAAPLQTVQQVATHPDTAADVRAALALAPLPAQRRSGGLGCMSVILSTAVAFAAAVVIGGISQFTLGTDYPAPGYRFGEAAVFSGVAAFIIVMVAMFSVFVWRQANYDRIYKQTVVTWYIAKTAYENDLYCTACQRRFPATNPTS